MPTPARDALSEQRSLSSEKDELQIARSGAKYVAIRFFESRAGHHQSGARGVRLTQPVGERTKPGPAIAVGKWNSCRHALHVFGGVIVIPLDEADSECTGKCQTDHGLARSGDAHHYVEAAR